MNDAAHIAPLFSAGLTPHVTKSKAAFAAALLLFASRAAAADPPQVPQTAPDCAQSTAKSQAEAMVQALKEQAVQSPNKTPFGTPLLERLNPLGMAADIMRSRPRVSTPRTFDPYGLHTRIEKEVARKGQVLVDAIPHLDHLEWRMREDGTSEFAYSDEVAAEWHQKAEEIVNSLPPNGFRNFDQLKATTSARSAAPAQPGEKQTFNPVITVDANAEGFFHLRNREDIRSFSFTGRDSSPPVRLDPELLDAARRDGSVSVTMALKMPAGFTALQGYVSKQAWDSQVRGMCDAFIDVVRRLDPAAVQTLNVLGAIPLAEVRLNEAAVRSLLNDPDPRISEVALPKPCCVPIGTWRQPD